MKCLSFCKNVEMWNYKKLINGENIVRLGNVNVLMRLNLINIMIGMIIQEENWNKSLGN